MGQLQRVRQNPGSFAAIAALVAATVFVSGCGGGKARINGISYPQHGVASWYGKKFHGRQTANGERYNMMAMTAAHRTLPFGTVVRVTNKENGKSIKVRINDRGPYIRGRIIDMSYGSAKKLRMVQDGIVQVRIDILRAPVAYKENAQRRQLSLPPYEYWSERGRDDSSG